MAQPSKKHYLYRSKSLSSILAQKGRLILLAYVESRSRQLPLVSWVGKRMIKYRPRTQTQSDHTRSRFGLLIDVTRCDRWLGTNVVESRGGWVDPLVDSSLIHSLTLTTDHSDRSQGFRLNLTPIWLKAVLLIPLKKRFYCTTQRMSRNERTCLTCGDWHSTSRCGVAPRHQHYAIVSNKKSSPEVVLALFQVSFVGDQSSSPLDFPLAASNRGLERRHVDTTDSPNHSRDRRFNLRL